MSLNRRILCTLPATLPKLCAMFGRSTNIVNDRLQTLRRMDLVKRSERIVNRPGRPGPKPHIWERA